MKAFGRLLFAFMFVCNAALFIALAYLFIGRGYYVVGGFTSVEVVTIVLSALAVMVTALGIFVALLAIWGYQSLHGTAAEIARKQARETAENMVRSELPAMMRREQQDQTSTERVLGETGADIAQDVVDSFDGDKR